MATEAIGLCRTQRSGVGIEDSDAVLLGHVGQRCWKQRGGMFAVGCRYLLPLLKVLVVITMIALSACSWNVATDQSYPKVSAEVLGTQIFVRQSGKPATQRVDFDVLRTGKATLRLANGAKRGARPQERVTNALVRLNGEEIAGPPGFNKGTNILHLPIELSAGRNTLSVELRGQPGQRISARIDAPPDAIRLEPVWGSLSVGESLQAKATLTALGRPVRDAAIEFRVKDLGKIAKRTALTGRAGVAVTTLRDFQRAGRGRLTAKALGVERALSATVPVHLVESPSIALQAMARVRLQPGVKRRVPFPVRFLKADAKRSEITFEQTVETDTGGIRLTPSGPVVVTPKAPKPSTLLVEGTLEALRPGTYTVTARATVKETGETASAKMEVKVIAPEPADALVLDPPAFVPAAVTVAKPTPVRFAAVARGVTEYPSALHLQEFDPKNNRWFEVRGGELHDDGLKGDLFAGDHVYARQLVVKEEQEGGKRYRVVFGEKGELAESRVRSLEITRFPVGPARRKPEFVQDEETDRYLAAEQVLVGFLPGVSARQIQDIVLNVTKKTNGVIGYIPQIDLVQVELPLTGGSDAARVAVVKAAVAEFETYDDKVRYAQPNFQIEFAGGTIIPDGDTTTQCIAIKPDGKNGQWAAWQIGAPQAWAAWETWAATGGSEITKKVAVADGQVMDDHPDLTGQIVQMEGGAGTDSDHGTRVAGIVAAKHGAPVAGITGIAYQAKVLSWNTTFSDTAHVSADVKAAANTPAAADTPEVGIINFSAAVGPALALGIKDAFEYATCPGDRPGDSICDCLKQGTSVEEEIGYTTADNGAHTLTISATSGGATQSGNVVPPATVASAEQNGTSILLGVEYITDIGGRLILRTDGSYDYTPPAAGVCKLAVVAADNQGSHICNDSDTGCFKKYPCSWEFPAVLCVANTNDTDALHTGPTPTNYGPAIDLTAPGTKICSPDISGSYSGDTGTSFAVPHVSGAAAVLWSMKTDLTAAQVAERLKRTAHPRPGCGDGDLDLGEHCDDGNNIDDDGCAANCGSGRLDLNAAVGYPDRLILVLDKSGSMAWSSHPKDTGCGVPEPAAGDCLPSRWYVLKEAVKRMLAVAAPYTEAEDRFAVAFFDTDASPADRWGPLGFDGLDSGISIATFVENPSRMTGGGTSIGAGMQVFESVLTGADASGYHQTILLFTDGDQNHPPYLVTDTDRVLINLTENLPDGQVHEFAPDVEICPFALRADDMTGELGTTYLQTIADLRCNTLMNSEVSIELTDTSLDEFFVQVLNGALVGDKLELVQVTSGQTQGGERFSATESFRISREDLAFTLLITWPEPGKGLEEVVLSKDKVDFPVTDGASRILTSRGDTYMAITLRRPYCRLDGKCVNSEGEWTLHMQPSAEVADKFTYNLFVIADNASLASEFRISQPEPGVGRPIRLTASLTEAGKPVHGLSPGSVRAALSRPKASLGNVLAMAKVEPVRMLGTERIGAAGRKASAMLAHPNLRTSILDAVQPAIETELILEESEPGFYEASYHDTRVSGIYSVRFNVNGESARNGKFTRTFTSARSVEVMADENATLRTVRVSPITPCWFAGGCFAITLTPVDAIGNLLGPGKARLIKVPKFSGRLLNPISDELDGRYTIRIGYPKPSLENPVIDIPGARLTIELGKSVRPVGPDVKAGVRP